MLTIRPNLNAICQWAFLILLVAGCAQPPFPIDDTHISGPISATVDSDIPRPITGLAYVPPTDTQTASELFTVVVNRVNVREVLFALARDAEINLDIHDGIEGTVTINAIDQSLPQILERIAQQIALHYEVKDGTLHIQPDLPVLKTYQVSYLNMERNAVGTVSVSSQIATAGNTSSGGGGGGGNNSSTTTLSNTTLNDFWAQLRRDISGLVAADETASGTVMINPVAGLVTVRATQQQHRFIEDYLDKLMENSQQQVLIEATLVEVRLSRDYQTGVDWSILGNQGFGFNQALTGANLSGPPNSLLTYTNTVSALGEIQAAVKALETFGDVKVLSSPKLTVMNNQTAMLKVVDDRVYFTLEVEPAVVSDGVVTPGTFETEIHIVPVGLVMTVTPQIGLDDMVTLNVRPSITRIVDFIQDPNPELAGNLLAGDLGITNLIPEVQVREIESVLQVASGQAIVLGGLMQDTVDHQDASIPLLSRLPVIGDAFTFRQEVSEKTELLIFIKPIIASQKSLSRGDTFKDYRQYLPTISGSGKQTAGAGPGEEGEEGSTQAGETAP